MIIKFKKILLFAFILIFQQGAAQTIKELSLEEVCNLAVANSNQLKLSANEVEIARTTRSSLKAESYPSIDISLSASYIGNGFVSDRNFSNHQVIVLPHFGNSFGIEASQIVFAGGVITANKKRATLEEKIAILNYEKNKLDICFLVTAYYLDLYKLTNRLEILNKNSEHLSLLIEQVKSRMNQGMALKSDLTRHELMLQNLRLSIIEAENNQKIINQQLVVTLGLEEETMIKTDSSLLNLNLTSDSPEDLINQARRDLPELQIAAINKEISDKEIKMAKADYYPKVAIIGSNSFNGPVMIEMPVINKISIIGL